MIALLPYLERKRYIVMARYLYSFYSFFSFGVGQGKEEVGIGVWFVPSGWENRIPRLYCIERRRRRTAAIRRWNVLSTSVGVGVGYDCSWNTMVDGECAGAR